MLGKLTKQLEVVKGKVSKAEVRKEVRRINTEKFAGGRGATQGVMRTEKRTGGRIRTSSLECDLGKVLDLAPGGMRVLCRKTPKERVGDAVSLTLRAEAEQMPVRGKIVWMRVDDECRFQVGVQFDLIGSKQKRELMALATTAQASEGLSRGWAPMFKTE
jgi:hypothetical protein